MKIFLIFLIITAFVNPVHSQSGWVQQNSTTTVNLYSVKFVNSQTGYCAGDGGVILKTTNSGTNWIHQSSGETINLRSISFPTSNIGYVVGDSGLIIKTSNGGNSWFKLISFITNSLESVFFVNEYIGFTGGYFGDPISLYKTTNGVSWDSIQIDANFINSIFFLNSEVGWATFGSSGVISGANVAKTTNGGFNWTFQYSSSVIPPAKDVFFIDSLNGWLSYKSSVFFPTILRTTNGGNNWITQFPGTGVKINSLYFTDNRNGWGAGENRIIQATTNGGVNWTNQTNTDSALHFRSVYFTDSLTGWVVGDNGIILKTTTGGVLTGFSNTSTEIPDKYSLSQNYPNPFNPNTIINFQCSMFNFISLRVFDVLGNEVETLVNENKPAGKYQIKFDGSNYPSGVYFYRLEIDGNIIDTKRMVLLK